MIVIYSYISVDIPTNHKASLWHQAHIMSPKFSRPWKSACAVWLLRLTGSYTQSIGNDIQLTCVLWYVRANKCCW